MIKIKNLVIFLAIPLLAGIIGYLLGGDTLIYDTIVKPSFAPPAIIFPIVWTILYILMGISSYLISVSNDPAKSHALTIYFTQLVVNVLWPLLFFRFNWFFVSFLWVILLIALVAYMIYLFYKINKTSALLQLPYILWLTFASILNFAVFYLN